MMRHTAPAARFQSRQTKKLTKRSAQITKSLRFPRNRLDN